MLVIIPLIVWITVFFAIRHKTSVLKVWGVLLLILLALAVTIIIIVLSSYTQW
jgi:hypothetical protein